MFTLVLRESTRVWGRPAPHDERPAGLSAAVAGRVGHAAVTPEPRRQVVGQAVAQDVRTQGVRRAGLGHDLGAAVARQVGQLGGTLLQGGDVGGGLTRQWRASLLSP